MVPRIDRDVEMGCSNGRLDILYETAIMLKHMVMPREGHLEQVLHIYGYLKQKKKFRIAFDPDYPQVSPNRFKKYDWEEFYRGVKEDLPPDMPDARGLALDIHVFVDASHAGDLSNRRSQTGILIFCNKAPIHWYSKSQSTVESSTFGSEFNAMRIAVEMVKSLNIHLKCLVSQLRAQLAYTVTMGLCIKTLAFQNQY